MIDYNPDPIYYQNIIPTQLDLSLVFLNNPPSNGNQWDMISLDFCFYDWLKKHPWKKKLLNESTPGMFDWWVKHPVNWVLMRYYLGNHSMHDDHDDVLWDSHPPYDFILGKSIENPDEIWKFLVDPQIKTFHLCIRTLAVVASAANRAAQGSDSAGSPKSDLDFLSIFRAPKKKITLW